MAKRFIDTGIFDDPWFMNLSKDSKILWIYLFTKCDHAGIIEVNDKLCKFQTNIKDLQTVYKELGNRLVTVKEQYFFIPKFLEFQYPNFPNSKVKAQISALNILSDFGLIDKESQTLAKGLTNSYDNEYDNDNGSETETEIKKLFRKFSHLSISDEENKKLMDHGYKQSEIDSIYDKIENFKQNNKYKSLYLTSLDWLKREHGPRTIIINKDLKKFTLKAHLGETKTFECKTLKDAKVLYHKSCGALIENIEETK